MRTKKTTPWMRIVSLVLCFQLFIQPLVAADRYVDKLASGAGTGLNWTDALNDLPSTPVRGTRYLIAGGNSTPATLYHIDWPNVSGTNMVEVRKATISDHGTDTGWSATKTNVAYFAPIVTITSWSIYDGVTGGGGDRSNLVNSAQYGFKIVDTSDTILFMISDKFGGPSDRANMTNVTIAHFEMSSSIVPGVCEGINLTASGANYYSINIISNYLHDIGDGPITIQHTDGGLVEGNYIGRNGSNPDHHGVLIRHDFSSNIGYYHNWFEDGLGTGFVGAYDGTGTNLFFSGNVFMYSNSGPPASAYAATGGGGAGTQGIGNGIIYTLNNFSVDINAHNWVIMNNTFYNTPGPIAIGLYVTDGSCYVRNNSFYKRFDGSTTTWTLTGVTDSDYNYFGSPTSRPTETHSVADSSNPFLDSANYDLRRSTQAIVQNIPSSVGGVTLPLQFSKDMNGLVRTNNEVTVGAFQAGDYTGAAVPDPGPSTALTTASGGTVAQGGTSFR